MARGGLAAANLRHASGTDGDCITHCAGDAIAYSKIRGGSVASKNSPFSARVPGTVKPGEKPEGKKLRSNSPPELAPATVSSLVPAEVPSVTQRSGLPLAS